MKFLYLLILVLISLHSVALAREPMSFSFSIEGRTIDVLMPNSQDIIDNITSSVSSSMDKLEPIFIMYEPIYILDKADLYKAYSEINNLGYIKKYCGIVLGAGLRKERNSAKPPVIELVMMTDFFSNTQVTVPFTPSISLSTDINTMNYYSDKYTGKAICIDKVILGNHIEGGINYILPYDYDLRKGLMEVNHTDVNYIQVF